jgi:aminoglycoside phosphotransferase (APT) family kinase protein
LLTLLDSGAKRLIDARENLPISMDRQVSTWLRSVAEWECGYYARFAQLTVPQAAQSTDTIKTLSQEKLLAHLQARLPDRGHIEVLDFGVNPGGFSNETFFFTLKSRSGEAERLVVRKNSPRAFFTHWAHRAREEFEIVRRVFEAGLPVPQPLWLFKDMPDVDGDYYVATRGAGRMVGNLKGASEFISEKLLFGLAEFLAKLHCIELEKFADYMSVGDTPVTIGDTISAAVRKNVEYLFQLWSSCERLPSPGEAFTIDWLRRNVPQNANRPVVVHTDCFVHNFLVTDDVISTVVDWEAAHFGDPAEDLAYIKDQVSALMSWERFMAHYRQAGGPAVDESTFDYYKCLLNFRNYFGTNVGVARIPNGYSDIRMIPLGGEFFPRFMQACIESAR